MPNYDSNLFNPPAPLAKVIVRNPETGASLSDVAMLIDSGADVTMIPKYCAEALGINISSEKKYELMSFDGKRSLVSPVRLEIVFLNKNFKGQFLLTEQDWGILGRNILNNLTLLLDGPRLTWYEQK